MNRNITLTVENLTDEQILGEFVKRFECDGAILLYMDNQQEFGFGRWSTQEGKNWMNNLLKIIKNSPLPKQKQKREKVKTIM